MTDLSLFRFSYPVEVRYADVDVLAHVNNAKYFTYMETARIHYFEEVLGWDRRWETLGLIIARATCDYKLPLTYGDTALVYLRTARIGGKSFDFEYVLVRQRDQAIAALGTTVQVAYDYAAGASVPVPDEWRSRIIAFEPALSP